MSSSQGMARHKRTIALAAIATFVLFSLFALHRSWQAGGLAGAHIPDHLSKTLGLEIQKPPAPPAPPPAKEEKPAHADTHNAPTSGNGAPPSPNTPSHSSSSSSSSSSFSSSSSSTSTDMSRFAYSLYVTNVDYLCNAVMMLESLHRVGVKADRLMLYPDDWEQPSRSVAALLDLARTTYGAKLKPVKIQHAESGEPTWADSYTKLLAFNQTQYERVLNLDTDGTVMQSMDELFLLPPAPLAAPYAYWLEDGLTTLSSQILLISPSAKEFARVEEQIRTHGPSDFDMEIVNTLYNGTAMVLPHRPYDLLTGEFKSTDHAHYLDQASTAKTSSPAHKLIPPLPPAGKKQWNATAELAAAKFVHFSDWPVPKPWVAGPEDVHGGTPKCVASSGVTGGYRHGIADCADAEAWLWLYGDFGRRKERVCGPALAL